MIFVVAPTQETWEFGTYLEKYGRDLPSRLRILTYDEILIRHSVPLGSYIFVAIDQLLPTEMEIAVQCCEQLSRACPDITLINRPTEVLLRYDLLQACFDLKRNEFRVRRASEFARCQEFPVFLRCDRDHNGSITGLLHTRVELVRAVARSLCKGYRLRDLIIVEYCDTVDPSGLFRKYSAFAVGGRILPHSVFHSTNWITKSHGRQLDAEKACEDLAYVQSNPHARWLREMFDLAKVGYGRIDYGLKNGKPQVWEINTNPTIVRVFGPGNLTEEQRRLRDDARRHFFSNFEAALEAIESVADPSQTVQIRVSQEQWRKLAAEKQLRLRAKTRRDAISQFAEFLRRIIRH
jgi:hypothetical protein